MGLSGQLSRLKKICVKAFIKGRSETPGSSDFCYDWLKKRFPWNDQLTQKPNQIFRPWRFNFFFYKFDGAGRIIQSSKPSSTASGNSSHAFVHQFTSVWTLASTCCSFFPSAVMLVDVIRTKHGACFRLSDWIRPYSTCLQLIANWFKNKHTLSAWKQIHGSSQCKLPLTIICHSNINGVMESLCKLLDVKADEFLPTKPHVPSVLLELFPSTDAAHMEIHSLFL